MGHRIAPREADSRGARWSCASGRNLLAQVARQRAALRQEHGLALTVVGDYDALDGTPEMTGTGDARLYGFFSSAPVTIAEIDRSNDHIMSQAPQPSVSIGGGWAFAFWGGTFWMFTAPGLGTQVDNYDPATQQTKTVVPGGSGITIVGAGVSTCAPQ